MRRTLKQEIDFNEELRDVMKEILSISVDEDENSDNGDQEDKEQTITGLVNKVMAVLCTFEMIKVFQRTQQDN